MLKSKWVGVLYAMGQRPSACGLQTDLVAAQPAGPSRLSFGRSTAILAATLAVLVGSESTALASSGCDAVNAGGFDFSPPQPNAPAFVTVNHFAVGDKIVFNVTLITGASWTLVRGTTNVPTTELDTQTTSTARPFTVTGNNGDTELSTFLFPVGSGTASQTARCTPAANTSNQNLDSQALRELQLQLSKTVATNSGAAITGAIDGAISDAFSASGGSPISAGPGGVRFNFAAEPQSDVARRTDQAFSALGYAGNITKAPSRVPDRDWSLWADVRGTGFDQNDALARMHGNQLNVTGGVGYKFAPDLLAGVFTGYEHFNYTVESLSGKLSGDGGTVGAYAAYRFAPHWRVDGALGWSDVAYGARAGTAAGSFTGSRWLATGALTGDYRYGAFVLEPSARIYALWESENAYTDSLGTLQAARNFSEGRVAAGGKVIYPWQATSDLLVSPYVGLYGDYRFSSDTALPVGIAFVGIKDGWSERVTGGLTMKSGLAGPSLSLGAELGGLGAGYDLWSANARMNWPF
jgi:hypothetical protein